MCVELAECELIPKEQGDGKLEQEGFTVLLQGMFALALRGKGSNSCPRGQAVGGDKPTCPHLE